MNEAIVMPFGKHRGRPLQSVDAGYLGWCLRECVTLDAGLRAAIGAELARRGKPVASGPAGARGHASRVSSPPARPAGAGRDAVFGLLSELLAFGVRVVARGDGAVHLHGREAGRLDTSLRARAALLHEDLDRLAAWVRWEHPGQPRRTPAALLLARLRASGTPAVALPGGGVVIPESPGGGCPLDTLSPGGRRELWFRLAANVPDPDACVPRPDGGRVPPNALAGLHAWCEKEEAKSKGGEGVLWRLRGQAVAALRAGQAAPARVVGDLAGYCRGRAVAMTRAGKIGAAMRWSGWALAVTEGAER